MKLRSFLLVSSTQSAVPLRIIGLIVRLVASVRAHPPELSAVLIHHLPHDVNQDIEDKLQGHNRVKPDPLRSQGISTMEILPSPFLTRGTREYRGFELLKVKVAPGPLDGIVRRKELPGSVSRKTELTSTRGIDLNR